MGLQLSSYSVGENCLSKPQPIGGASGHGDGAYQEDGRSTSASVCH